jgi:hypothetical protein
MDFYLDLVLVFFFCFSFSQIAISPFTNIVAPPNKWQFHQANFVPLCRLCCCFPTKNPFAFAALTKH